MRLKKEQILYVRSMGKTFRVTAIFADQAQVDAYIARHRDEVVVAQFGPYTLLADQYDPGVEIRAT